MSIKLTDAAQYFNKEQHQLAAWNWLESKIPVEVLNEFADKYRTKTSAKPTFATTGDNVQVVARPLRVKFLGVASVYAGRIFKYQPESGPFTNQRGSQFPLEYKRLGPGLWLT